MYQQAPDVCIAAVGGMTAALKAQHVLLSAGVAAEVLSLSPSQTKRGCAFGVSFPCTALQHARATLREGGVTVSQFIQRKGPLT